MELMVIIATGLAAFAVGIMVGVWQTPEKKKDIYAGISPIVFDDSILEDALYHKKPQPGPVDISPRTVHTLESEYGQGRVTFPKAAVVEWSHDVAEMLIKVSFRLYPERGQLSDFSQIIQDDSTEGGLKDNQCEACGGTGWDPIGEYGQTRCRLCDGTGVEKDDLDDESEVSSEVIPYANTRYCPGCGYLTLAYECPTCRHRLRDHISAYSEFKLDELDKEITKEDQHIEPGRTDRT